jgi:hypothetical protein
LAVRRFPHSPLSIVLLKTTAKKHWCSKRDSGKLKHFRVLKKYIVSLLPQWTKFRQKFFQKQICSTPHI